jgi:hypothetical protein
MALTILIRGQLDSIPVLSDDCFTKQNYGIAGHANATLSVNTPRGVLGGSVAAVSAGLDYTVVPGTDVLRPVGLFVNDAAGAAFENSPAVASGKLAVMKAMASVEVDVYETVEADNTTPLVFSVGDLLYSSLAGLLTNEVSNEAAPKTVIGICTKMPTTSSPTLGLDMRI